MPELQVDTNFASKRSFKKDHSRNKEGITLENSPYANRNPRLTFGGDSFHNTTAGSSMNKTKKYLSQSIDFESNLLL